MSPTDPDSRIAKMKDGRTHLAYKAEHVVDLETEVVLAAPDPSWRRGRRRHDGRQRDGGPDEPLGSGHRRWRSKRRSRDKGYHATDTLELAESLSIRTYIPEPKRKGNGKRNWQDVAEEKRQAVLNNRRRTRGSAEQAAATLRSELVERSFAHICETGGARRSWLCGIEKVQKRYLIAAVARNLGLVMRKLFGIGTPRGLQAEGGLVSSCLFAWLHVHRCLWRWHFVSLSPGTVSPAYATAV